LACNSAPNTEALREPLLEDFAKDTLAIETAEGKLRQFAIYVAHSDEEMKQGLMFVRELNDDAGMLFTYRQNRTGSMWMKNTFVSLDILFIKADGTISDIAVATTPHSLKSIRSTVPVRGALELKAGVTEKMNINVGDRVLHPHFHTAEN